ncbi:MAG: CFI-box-CTERM domain-containing protein [Myxococcota bacterium]
MVSGFPARFLSFVALAALALPGRASAQDRVLEVEFTPTERAQLAVWLEAEDGSFVRTLLLTNAVGKYGIGNRPGALQMNSGYRWPYGRREGALPVWGHRRADAQGPFARVIFQDRRSEGYASRTSSDFSPDAYFCLSFDRALSDRDALDAVTCASQFNSDKGRYITDDDVDAGYTEPWIDEAGAAGDRALTLTSVYPPRRDLGDPVLSDHPDVARFAGDARDVMPEIDAVTTATLPGDTRRRLTFAVPDDIPDGAYLVWLEVNTEGDYSDAWGPERFPGPTDPTGTRWDTWAVNFGYPYRGQPSVVYAVPITLSGAEDEAGTATPVGYGDLEGETGTLRAMDATIAADPDRAPGSGTDRLRIDGQSGHRLVVRVVGTNVCEAPNPPPECGAACTAVDGCGEGFLCDVGAGTCVGRCELDATPDAIADLGARADADRSWDRAQVELTLPSSLRGLGEVEIRVSPDPFDGSVPFESWGVTAKTYSEDNEEETFQLLLQAEQLAALGAGPGDRIAVDLAGLAFASTHYVGVRAKDECGRAGPVATAQLQTTEIVFETVSPCFVATASYGTPQAEEIGVLRRFRDRYLRSTSLGEELTQAYYAHGPVLAAEVRESETLRRVSRSVLEPVLAFAEWLER